MSFVHCQVELRIHLKDIHTPVALDDTSIMAATGASEHTIYKLYSFKFKLLMTLFCYFLNINLGIIYLLPTTALIDLTYLFDSTIVILSYGLTVRAVATSIGSVLIGLLYKVVDRRIGFVLGMFSAATLVMTVPFLDSWIVFMVIMMALGLTAAIVDVAANSMILDLWGEECNSYMQGLYFSYGLGIALAPLCITPFMGLEPKVLSIESNSTELPVTEDTLATLRDAKVTVKPLLDFQLVFVLVGICGIIASLAECAMCWIENRKRKHILAKSSTEQVMSIEMDSPEVMKVPMETCEDEPKKKLAIFLGFLIVLFYVGMEVNSLNFVTEFVHFLGYNVETAAQQATIMSSSYAFFRFTGIFVSRFVVTDHMVLGHLSTIVVSALILLFLTQTSLAWISLAIFILGSGCSVIYPCIYSMIEERVHLSNAAVGILASAGCIPGMLYPLIIPSVMKMYPMVYVYNIMVSIVLVFICVALLIKFIPKPKKVDTQVPIVKTRM